MENESLIKNEELTQSKQTAENEELAKNKQAVKNKKTVKKKFLKIGLPVTAGVVAVFIIAGLINNAIKISKFNAIGAEYRDGLITFGTYEQDNKTDNGKEAIEWLVLDIKDGKALVVSKYALDCKPYDQTHKDVTWETCTLRKWLNNEFLNDAFNDAQKSKILTSTVPADMNPKYITNPGKETQDKIFLLSINEANKYFLFSGKIKCTPTSYATNNGAERNRKNGNCQWWLRSPDYDYTYASCVSDDGEISGRKVYNTSELELFGKKIYMETELAVRPAMWIDLKA